MGFVPQQLMSYMADGQKVLCRVLTRILICLVKNAPHRRYIKLERIFFKSHRPNKTSINISLYEYVYVCLCPKIWAERLWCVFVMSSPVGVCDWPPILSPHYYRPNTKKTIYHHNYAAPSTGATAAGIQYYTYIYITIMNEWISYK